MTERYYEFAGICWRIRFPNVLSYQESDSLAPFAVESGNCVHHTLEFEPVERLSQPEGERVFCEPNRQFYSNGNVRIRYQGATSHSLKTSGMRIRREGTHSCIQVKNDWLHEGLTTKIVLNSMEAEHFIVQNHGLLLHASFIQWKGEAILFTAPSGTGKSTQADLWSACRGAEIINGDRVAVMVSPSGVRAWGIPFCGSSGISKNIHLPLKAIVYLSQAPKTTIQRLTGLRAFSRVWEGCCVNAWDRDDLHRCTDAVIQAVTQVPVFHLACTPDETAVVALECALLEMR